MLIATLECKNNIVLRNIQVPETSNDEVLVEVHSCGICGSDLHEFKIGPFFWLPHKSGGHEFGGHVKKIGTNVDNVKIGDKVVFKYGFPCGKCEYCQLGKENLCVIPRISCGMQCPTWNLC
jgi:threonine dehydrogenase-like Zn-dependent dehydrogenase